MYQPGTFDSGIVRYLENLESAGHGRKFLQSQCNSLNENDPQRFIFECLV